MTRRPRLDQHRPLKANETVGDLTVVMPWYALSGRKAQHLDAQIGALGDQFAAGDRIITAIAPLHRSRSFLCPLTHFADPKGSDTILVPLAVPSNKISPVSGRRGSTMAAVRLMIAIAGTRGLNPLCSTSESGELPAPSAEPPMGVSATAVHGEPEGSFSVPGPIVRIHLPPAVSQANFRIGAGY